jgi:hypothetical protein
MSSHTQGDCYMACIDDKVTVKLGPRFYLGELLPPATEWEMAVSDSDMCVWVKKGLKDPPAVVLPPIEKAAATPTTSAEGETTSEASSGGAGWAAAPVATAPVAPPVAMAAMEVGTAEAAAMTEAYEAAAAETAAEEEEAATPEEVAAETVMTTEEEPGTSQDEGIIEAMKEAYDMVSTTVSRNTRALAPTQSVQFANTGAAGTHDVPALVHAGGIRGGRGEAARGRR